MKNSSQTLYPEKQNPKQEGSLQQSQQPILSSTSSSSPTHDFSFTISLSSSSSSSKPISPTLRNLTKTTSSYHQETAVDLSPADDIFFHGHLLPLQLFSHLPVSPRASTGSYNDGFALPLKDISPDQPTTNNTNNENVVSVEKQFHQPTDFASTNAMVNIGTESKTKPIKPFSIFGLSKWRKAFESNQKEQEEQQQQQQQQQQKKKPMSLELSHTVKKYIKMLFQRRENGTQFRNRRQAFSSSYSFSSSLMKGNNSKTMIDRSRDLMNMRGRRCELFSAPASMRTSPTNSGHLRVSTAGLSSSSASTSSSSSDSTMEELQAAIQAAIAHCKNSSCAGDDKVMDS